MAVSTTRLSSKGQVVIPEEVRDRLHLKEGDQFVVIGQGDTVIFKTITPPSLDQFEDLLEKVRLQARDAGVTKADLRKAISKVRRKK